MKIYRVRYLMSNHHRFIDLPNMVEGRNIVEVSERADEEIRRITGGQPVATIKLEWACKLSSQSAILN